MRVLVSAASRHGATDQIAAVITGVLENAGIEVDSTEPELVTTVEPYDGVVIGSAIYAGQWLAPARELVGREATRLLGKPVWLFSSGPIGDPAKPDEPPPQGVELAARVSAVDHGVFPGKLDPGDLGFAEKAVIKVLRSPTGDFRPWEDVIEWARGVADNLTARATTRPAGRGAG